MKTKLPELDWTRINTLISLALDEDLGKAGDVTSISVIPPGTKTTATLLAREECVCAGLQVAEAVFKRLDRNVKFSPLVQDGQLCRPNTVLAKIAGRAQAMLSAERTALNFLQRLCGVATASFHYAQAVKGSKTKILDTRKTTPGWRNLEKYAVAAGGATNHRIGLYDRIMIKDNHRTLAGFTNENGIKDAVEKARRKYPALVLEVEADALDDVKKALDAGADCILLDNMDNRTMKKAVAMVGGRAKTEASGGISLGRLAKIAEIGVDFISCGSLTHSVKAIDISMEISTD